MFVSFVSVGSEFKGRVWHPGSFDLRSFRRIKKKFLIVVDSFVGTSFPRTLDDMPYIFGACLSQPNFVIIIPSCLIKKIENVLQ